jgi:calmodulin
MNELSKDNQNFYKLKFNEYAKDSGGLISFDDLNDLIKACKIKCSEANVQDLVNELDINEKGQINVKMFLEIISKLIKKDDEEELREAFKIFDTNNTNLINEKQLLNVLSKFDANLKEEDALVMIEEYDLDHDGYLNFEEFCLLMKNK